MSSKAFIGLLAAISLGVALWYRAQVPGDNLSTAGPRPRLAVVTGGPGPFWQLIGNGAQAAAGDHNVEVEVLHPDQSENIDVQTKLLLSLNTDRLDGVGISPLDAEGQTAIIDRIAKKAFVVTFDSDASLSDRLSYVGTSNVAAGEKCARIVKEALPKGGKIAVILANLSKQNLVERKRAFEETITQADGSQDGESPNYEIVDFLVDDGDDQKSAELIRATLAEYPELDCLVGMNAQHGPMLMRVLSEEQKLGKIKIVAFDEEQETLAGIEAGHIFATVAQDPYLYGYQTVQALASFCRASESQRPLPGSKSTLTINTQVVRQDNLAEFRQQLESRLAATQ